MINSIIVVVQVDEEQYKKILSLIDIGKSQGAKIQCGGNKTGDKGYFIQNTIFSDVTPDMKIAKEEVCLVIFALWSI